MFKVSLTRENATFETFLPCSFASSVFLFVSIYEYKAALKLLFIVSIFMNNNTKPVFLNSVRFMNNDKWACFSWKNSDQSERVQKGCVCMKKNIFIFRIIGLFVDHNKLQVGAGWAGSINHQTELSIVIRNSILGKNFCFVYVCRCFDLFDSESTSFLISQFSYYPSGLIRFSRDYTHPISQIWLKLEANFRKDEWLVSDVINVMMKIGLQHLNLEGKGSSLRALIIAILYIGPTGDLLNKSSINMDVLLFFFGPQGIRNNETIEQRFLLLLIKFGYQINEFVFCWSLRVFGGLV